MGGACSLVGEMWGRIGTPIHCAKGRLTHGGRPERLPFRVSVAQRLNDEVSSRRWLMYVHTVLLATFDARDYIIAS